MRDEAELRGSLNDLEGLARVEPLASLGAALEAREALPEALEAYTEILQLNLAHDEAREALLRLEERGVSDPDAQSALVRVELHHQSWDEAAARLERIEGLDPIRRYRRLAQLHAFAEAPSEAFDWALKALRADPADAVTVEGLAHFAAPADAELQLAWLFAELIPPLSEAERGPLMSALLELCEAKLEEDREAILLNLYEQEVEDERLLVALEAPFKRALDEGGSRVEKLFELATFREETLKRPLSALKTLEEIQGLDPSHPDIFPRIRHILSSREDWQALTEQILDRLLFVSDEEERVALFDEAARLYEIQLEDPERAFSITLQAFGEAFDDERYGEELWRLAEASNQQTALFEQYQAAINQNDPEAAQPLRARLADWYGEEEPALAAEQLQALLELDPRDEALLEGLSLRLRQAGDMRGLADHLARWAEEAFDEGHQVELLQERAGVLESLGEVEAAIATRLALLDLDEDPQNLDALETLAEEAGQFNVLVDVLQRRAGLVDGEERVDIFLRLAALFERLSKLNEAVDAYQDAIYIDEECLPALQGLERLYRQMSRWDALLEIYRMILQLELSKEEHMRVLEQVALIQEEELDDVQAAIDAYREMAAIAPRDLIALKALERLHRDEERWDDLADIYTEHLEALTEERDKTELRRSLSAVFDKHLKQPLRAIRVLEPILDDQPDEPETLMSIARLQDQIGEHQTAVELWEKVAGLVEGEPRFEAWRCAARALDGLDAEAAEALRLKIFEAGGADMETLNGLQARFVSRGEWPELIELLKRAPKPTASTHALLGQAHLELGVLEEAEGHFKAALELDPVEANALDALSSMYLMEDRHAEAEPLLERLMPLLHDDAARGEMSARLGTIALNTGRAAQAQGRFAYAIEVGYESVESLSLYGGLLFESESLPEAFEIYARILERFEEELEEEAQVELLYRMGLLKARLGEASEAISLLERALERRPDDLELRRALLEQLEQAGEWTAAIARRRQLVEALPAGAERLAEELRLAEILAGPAEDLRGAVESYQRAIEMEGADVPDLLSKLASLSERLGDIEACVEYLRRQAYLETDAKARALALLELGDQLAERAETAALGVYEEALDVDPTQLMAFRNLEQLLLKQGDYLGQDAAYRRMLKRAQEHPLEEKFIITLARNLGEINRTSLQRYEEARDAYLIALEYAPKNQQLHVALIEIYAQMGQHEESFKHRQRLLEIAPRNSENLKGFYELFTQSEKKDPALCVANALVFLRSAEAKHTEAYEQGRQPIMPGSMLEPGHWSWLNHADKNPQIDQIFAKLYKIAAPLMTVTHRELKIHKKKNLITARTKSTFNEMIEIALQRTGFDRVDLYQGAGDFTGMRVVNLGQPAILVSPDLLSGLPPAQMMFVAARTLFMTTPKYFFAALDRTRDARIHRLLVMIYTLSKSLKPDASIPREYLDENLLRAFGRCSEIERQGLLFLLNKLGQLNLAGWLEGVVLTSDRLGLLLCGDISAAAQGIQLTDNGVLSVNARIDRLLRYSISEDYFKLREALELA